MIDPKKLEEIAKQIHNALPPGIRSMGEEVEKKTRQVLQAQLGKLDLVSREEFDVQTKVLLRTREKLTALEAKLAQLEQQLGAKGEKYDSTSRRHIKQTPARLGFVVSDAQGGPIRAGKPGCSPPHPHPFSREGRREQIGAPRVVDGDQMNS